ncbi:hypothetical protein SAMN05216389_1334 [Oceanobacillus limi]|uniref:Uncharacterized protein n=1 Tax=Oceanobacillus limi TaxID=930131 RepID=A0A1I0HEF5_9BACI|nr:hypothetical protein [Oceanobacillus limi]SET82147.1 hypothetical protein SAMN05216389_1334 [Oceanobacillus limi]
MKNPAPIVIALLLLFIIAISVYTYKSEDTVIQNVSEVAKTTFHSNKEITTNYNNSGLAFFLPEGLEVEEEDANNAILTSGDQTYIVFYNQFEAPISDLNYLSASNDEAVLLESYEDDHKFGYVRLMPSESHEYELQVGIGGVKITTFTTTGTMERDTEQSMLIARSIVESEEN